MRSADDITEAITALEARVKVYEAYRDECVKIKTRHGVMDAEADMREIEAQIRALDWVLEVRDAMEGIND